MHEMIQEELFGCHSGVRSNRTGQRDTVIRSVYQDQNAILEAIQKLHVPAGFECDATFGSGAFWKTIKRPALCFDIEPRGRGVQRGDFKCLPLTREQLGSICLDPPFLTYIRNGRNHQGGDVVMSKRFGGYYTYSELEDDYQSAISECYRVLKPKGVLVFKCQDIIHNHRMHCTHARVINFAEMEGFRLLDLFVLVAKHRMPAPQKGKQRHARIFHSYFLVFLKNP